ncbi:hypothetical protein NST99_15420 [Paenibacillus sp. FSL L8-0470]|uniref:hypothetical protein n=1 Tax=Paenibacillus sp. FSL L8-0470 TaxID=2954688 RepID=UPI0030F83FF1
MKSYILGVDLGGTNIKAGLFDTDFTVIRELSTATEAAKGPAFVLERIRNAVHLDGGAWSCFGADPMHGNGCPRFA